MLMEALKTAIVGCGKVGHIHAKALGRAPESRFVAACGRDLARTQKFAATYNVKAYCDVEEMIAREGVQALTICTPHPLHALHAVKALKAGVHVLVEKPLASSLADCDAILDAAKTSGAKVGMVSQRRFYAPVRARQEGDRRGQTGTAHPGFRGDVRLARRGVLPQRSVARFVAGRRRRSPRQSGAAPA